MRIRGIVKPKCSVCSFFVCDKETKSFICSVTKKETKDDFSCKDFKYDIFKYKPSSKFDLNKFSKEDFEI